MICTISLNPAVDKYIRLRHWEAGAHLEAIETVTSAGGKAINVAGVLRALGEEVELIGFFGGFTGDYILEASEREGIRCNPVMVQALTRTAFVLVDETGAETEVVEPGAAVTQAEIDALRSKVREAVARAAVVVLSGSVPPGCADDIYLQLLADCNGRCPVIVDTSRVWLRRVLAGRDGFRPAAVKPNRREAEAALGYRLATTEALAQGLQSMAGSGIGLALLSDGAAGLYAWSQDQLWLARPPQVQQVNSVGSGDATVAGMAAAWARGEGLAARLQLGVACGAANVLTKECAQVRPEDVARLLPQVELLRLDPDTYRRSVPSTIETCTRRP